jgi:hypothetical protein
MGEGGPASFTHPSFSEKLGGFQFSAFSFSAFPPERRIGASTPIPAAENLHRSGLDLNTVEDFEMLFHNRTPDLWPLPNSGMAFRKEPETLPSFNNQLSQFARRHRVMVTNSPNDLLEIAQESFCKDYFEEVH